MEANHRTDSPQRDRGPPVFGSLFEVFMFFDFGLAEWWAGLNRGLRLSTAVAITLAGGVAWLLGGSWLWWVPLVVLGAALLVAAIEIKDG
jgi:hypothetical protein